MSLFNDFLGLMRPKTDPKLFEAISQGYLAYTSQFEAATPKQAGLYKGYLSVSVPKPTQSAQTMMDKIYTELTQLKGELATYESPVARQKWTNVFTNYTYTPFSLENEPIFDTLNRVKGAGQFGVFTLCLIGLYKAIRASDSKYYINTENATNFLSILADYITKLQAKAKASKPCFASYKLALHIRDVGTVEEYNKIASDCNPVEKTNEDGSVETTYKGTYLDENTNAVVSDADADARINKLKTDRASVRVSRSAAENPMAAYAMSRKDRNAAKISEKKTAAQSDDVFNAGFNTINDAGYPAIVLSGISSDKDPTGISAIHDSDTGVLKSSTWTRFEKALSAYSKNFTEDGSKMDFNDALISVGATLSDMSTNTQDPNVVDFCGNVGIESKYMIYRVNESSVKYDVTDIANMLYSVYDFLQKSPNSRVDGLNENVVEQLRKSVAFCNCTDALVQLAELEEVTTPEMSRLHTSLSQSFKDRDNINVREGGNFVSGQNDDGSYFASGICFGAKLRTSRAFNSEDKAHRRGELFYVANSLREYLITLIDTESYSHFGEPDAVNENSWQILVNESDNTFGIKYVGGANKNSTLAVAALLLNAAVAGWMRENRKYIDGSHYTLSAKAKALIKTVKYSGENPSVKNNPYAKVNSLYMPMSYEKDVNPDSETDSELNSLKSHMAGIQDAMHASVVLTKNDLKNALRMPNNANLIDKIAMRDFGITDFVDSKSNVIDAICDTAMAYIDEKLGTNDGYGFDKADKAALTQLSSDANKSIYKNLDEMMQNQFITLYRQMPKTRRGNILTHITDILTQLIKHKISYIFNTFSIDVVALTNYIMDYSAELDAAKNIDDYTDTEEAKNVITKYITDAISFVNGITSAANHGSMPVDFNNMHSTNDKAKVSQREVIAQLRDAFTEDSDNGFYATKMQEITTEDGNVTDPFAAKLIDLICGYISEEIESFADNGNNHVTNWINNFSKYKRDLIDTKHAIQSHRSPSEGNEVEDYIEKPVATPAQPAAEPTEPPAEPSKPAEEVKKTIASKKKSSEAIPQEIEDDVGAMNSPAKKASDAATTKKPVATTSELSDEEEEELAMMLG